MILWRLANDRHNKTRKTRVYISGPISNNPNYKEDFENARRLLKSVGYIPVSPIQKISKYKIWHDYMRVAISRMLTCDAYVQLPGWEQSIGCNIEHFIAKCLNYKLI